MAIKPGRGRPVGSVQTPRTLLQQDMREAAKLNKDIRELLTEQIKEIRKELSDTPSFDKRLKVVEVLTKSLELQGKGIDSTAKHLLTETASGEGEQDADRDAVLRQLTGGAG